MVQLSPAKHRHARRMALKVLLAGAALGSMPLLSMAAATPEYQIKAAFLFHFVQFVDWPDSAFETPSDPLVVGILGDDPFGSTLDEIMRDEKVHGRSITIERYASAENARRCHLLFVSLRSAMLRGAMDQLGPAPILTVSDAEGFLEQGGIVRLFTEQGRIRIGINLQAAERARLRLSSKLLRSAQVVGRSA